MLNVSFVIVDHLVKFLRNKTQIENVEEVMVLENMIMPNIVVASI